MLDKLLGCCCSDEQLPREAELGRGSALLAKSLTLPLDGPGAMWPPPAAVASLSCGSLHSMHQFGGPRFQMETVDFTGDARAGEPVCTESELPAPPRAVSSTSCSSSWLLDVETKKLSPREQLSSFVRTLVNGCAVEVLLEDGETARCQLTLAKDLRTIWLRDDQETHIITLRDVHDVTPGKVLPVAHRKVRGSSFGTAAGEGACAQRPLDERCVTLVLSNNECVTFRMDSMEARDEYVSCLSWLTGPLAAPPIMEDSAEAMPMTPAER